MRRRIISFGMAVILTLALAATAAGAGCPCNVEFRLGTRGVTSNRTVIAVNSDNKPNAASIPNVQGLDGWAFLGWSTTDPASGTVTLVDPSETRMTEDTTFYAVYEPYHKHYVIGYPGGLFGPEDNITRGSVATIIARAGFEGVSGVTPFHEGTIYANNAGFIDVAGHWAESAISYCAMNGVFQGYGDGLFKPDQPITREEYVAAVTRLARNTGKLSANAASGEDFADMASVGTWAVEDLRKARAAGWIDGYEDGTFKPQNSIRRDEAVKIFNGYLKRGVDAAGLTGLREYVHTGVASNNTENGTDEYMTWSDVPKEHWAYYEIIEAANDHSYDESKTSLPEKWSRCWIDEVWRYHDDAGDNGPQG